MLHVSVLLDDVDLVIVHEAVDVGALFEESGPKKRLRTRLQLDHDVEDIDDEIVSFMRTAKIRGRIVKGCLALQGFVCSMNIKGCHDLIHDTMNCDKLEDWARNIPYKFEFPDHLVKQLLRKFFRAHCTGSAFLVS